MMLIFLHEPKPSISDVAGCLLEVPHYDADDGSDSEMMAEYST
jgi:hypothetical protein